MIAMDCARCGKHHEVAETLAGQTLYCSGCNSAMRIPAPGSAESHFVEPVVESRLKLAGLGRSSDGGRLCPACGLAMTADTIVCVGCGFNTQTGLGPADIARRRRAVRARISLALFLLVIGAAAWGVALLYRSSPTTADGDGAAVVPFPDEPEAVPFEPLPPEAVAAVRKELTAALDREAPVLIPGQNCALALGTGRILRGTLQRISPGLGAHLILETGEIMFVEIEDLDPRSRIQIDPAARAEELERRVQVQIAL